jgi:hypothetical protein
MIYLDIEEGDINFKYHPIVNSQLLDCNPFPVISVRRVFMGAVRVAEPNENDSETLFVNTYRI